MGNASGGQNLTPMPVRTAASANPYLRARGIGTSGGSSVPVGGATAAGAYGYTKPTLATLSDGEVDAGTAAGQARRAGSPLAGAVSNSAEMVQYTADQVTGPTADLDYQSTLFS